VLQCVSRSGGVRDLLSCGADGQVHVQSQPPPQGVHAEVFRLREDARGKDSAGDRPAASARLLEDLQRARCAKNSRRQGRALSRRARPAQTLTRAGVPGARVQALALLAERTEEGTSEMLSAALSDPTPDMHARQASSWRIAVRAIRDAKRPE
jgi:hypothetical protein